MEDVHEAVGIKHVLGDSGRVPVWDPEGRPRSFFPDQHFQRDGEVRDEECPNRMEVKHRLIGSINSFTYLNITSLEDFLLIYDRLFCIQFHELTV